jgi:hypothetical protein
MQAHFENNIKSDQIVEALVIPLPELTEAERKDIIEALKKHIGDNEVPPSSVLLPGSKIVEPKVINQNPFSLKN